MAVIFKKAKVVTKEKNKSKAMIEADNEYSKDCVPIHYNDLVSDDGCYHLASPIWTIRKAPIPAGIVGFPERGLKVKVDWTDPKGVLVFPGIHVISKEEYDAAPKKEYFNDKPVKMIDCHSWIRLD